MQIILLIFFSGFIQASVVKAFKVEIRHPRTALTLEWDGKTLSVKDRNESFDFVKKDCNQKLIQDFLEVDQHLWKLQPDKGVDFVEVKKGSENFKFSVQSKLGNHLLTLKDKLIIMKGQESVRCNSK